MASSTVSLSMAANVAEINCLDQHCSAVAGNSKFQAAKRHIEPLATWPVTSPKNLHPVVVCF
jgi:hypothetical protein